MMGIEKKIKYVIDTAAALGIGSDFILRSGCNTYGEWEAGISSLNPGVRIGEVDGRYQAYGDSPEQALDRLAEAMGFPALPSVSNEVWDTITKEGQINMLLSLTRQFVDALRAGDQEKADRIHATARHMEELFPEIHAEIERRWPVKKKKEGD